MDEALRELAGRLGEALVKRGWLLGCAESCTGGLLASTLTDTSGASAWFVGAVVSYSNAVKREVLGVPQAILDTKGAVSRETVMAMVSGVRSLLGADAAVSISGIAGPLGGTPQKPVGTVWMAWKGPEDLETKCFHFEGDRLAIKRQSVYEAMLGVLRLTGEGQ